MSDPYRKADPAPDAGPTRVEIALEAVRILQGNPYGAHLDELQAVALLRIANVLEEWRDRGFK